MIAFQNCYQGIFFSSVRNHAETYSSHLSSQQPIALGTYPAFTSSFGSQKVPSYSHAVGWLNDWVSWGSHKNHSTIQINCKRKSPRWDFIDVSIKIVIFAFISLHIKLHINRDGSLSASIQNLFPKITESISCYFHVSFYFYWCFIDVDSMNYIKAITFIEKKKKRMKKNVKYQCNNYSLMGMTLQR